MEGYNTILSKSFPSATVLMLNGKEIYYRLSICLKLFMNVDIIILEQTTPIRINMFHHRIKLVSQNNVVLTCSDSSL